LAACSRYLFGRRLIETLSSLALRSIVFTDLPNFAAISDRVAPFVAIEISVRSSFNVNRPRLLPTIFAPSTDFDRP
jgi:hypothetical protein